MNLFNRLQVSNTTTKSFSYKKGNVALNFSLRTDIKQDMKDFLECIKKAQEEIEEELKK